MSKRENNKQRQTTASRSSELLTYSSQLALLLVIVRVVMMQKQERTYDIRQYRVAYAYANAVSYPSPPSFSASFRIAILFALACLLRSSSTT